MNDTQITEYLKKLKSIKLSNTAHTDMKRRLSEYADFHSTGEAVRVFDSKRSIERVPEGTLVTRLIGFKFTYMTAVILLVLMIGGGTSFAAQSALPGDFLYPVKVEINENVESAFAVSNKSEATLQAKLVEERLSEAEKLAVKGTLTNEASLELRNRIEAHYMSARSFGEAAEAEGELELSVNTIASLDGIFNSYATTLTEIDVKAGRNDTEEIVTDIRAFASLAGDGDATAATTMAADANTSNATMMQVDETGTTTDTDEGIHAKSQTNTEINISNDMIDTQVESETRLDLDLEI